MELLVLFGLVLVTLLWQAGTRPQASGAEDWIGPAGRLHVNPDRWFAAEPDSRPQRLRSRSLSQELPSSRPGA